MSNTDFILRPMQPGDVKAAMKLSNEEGWNQLEKDWMLLIENPENVSMIAEFRKKIIGTTTAINYANQVAWIGMVLVDREYRGQGVSKLLITNILKKLEHCKSIKLDATPQGEQVYKKFDFKDEYLIARMVNTSMKNLATNDDDGLVELIQSKHIQEIIALDEMVFGANRTELIKSVVNEYPNKSWLLKRNNRISGFVLGRDGYKYHHIGPVEASNIIDAKILISKALKNLIDQPVAMDVLSDKEELMHWLNSIGFIKQRDFVRMYRKENPLPGMTEKNYLICGPEFG
jgi:predicted GNAT family N-acyltransferase